MGLGDHHRFPVIWPIACDERPRSSHLAFNPQWGWVLWTFFGGFVFSYLRQKTNGILAPAVVHGLPQALVYLFLRI
jgi:membrane protease YdiL (CAAX protease family)